MVEADVLEGVTAPYRNCLGDRILLPESRVTSCCVVHEMHAEETEEIYQLLIRLTHAESK